MIQRKQYYAIVTTDDHFISCVHYGRFNHLGNHPNINLDNAHKILMSYQDACDLLQCLFDIRNKRDTNFKGAPHFGYEIPYDHQTGDAMTKAIKVIPVNFSIEY